MEDLTIPIDKPYTILPESDGIPKIGNTGLTPEQALDLAINEALKRAGKAPLAISKSIIQQVLSDNNNPHNATLDLVSQVLQLSGVTSIGKVSVAKVLSDLKIPTGISSYALNFTDGLSILNAIPDTYGVYQKNGVLALSPDTITANNITASAKISSHPLQGGTFANFNKVQEPNKVVVKMAKSGQGKNAKSMRDAFIKQLEGLKQGVELLSIVTPNKVFQNMSLTGYNYRFESGGTVGMIVVEATFEEVREVAAKYTTQAVTNSDGTPAINNPQSVNAESPQSGGMANPTPPTTDERNIVERGVDWIIAGVRGIF